MREPESLEEQAAMESFEDRQHARLRERHLKNARFTLERLIDNAQYALRVLEHIDNPENKLAGMLPGDHLTTYVNSYERSLAALEALKEDEEI
jgi:hypothetical protein